MKAKKSPYKMILFDLDGTLASSLEAGLGAMNLLRFVFGYKKLDKDDPRLRLTTGMDFVKNILDLNILQALLWMKMLKLLVVRQAPRIAVYPGWKAVLARLKSRYSLGVVTSSPRVYASTILKNAKLDIFDVLVTNVRYHRKDASLKKILTRHKLKPSQVLYIGDELRDFEACRKNQIPFVAVSWGKDHEDLFLPYRKTLKAMIHKPRDLTRVLKVGKIA